MQKFVNIAGRSAQFEFKSHAPRSWIATVGNPYCSAVTVFYFTFVGAHSTCHTLVVFISQLSFTVPHHDNADGIRNSDESRECTTTPNCFTLIYIVIVRRWTRSTAIPRRYCCCILRSYHGAGHGCRSSAPQIDCAPPRPWYLHQFPDASDYCLWSHIAQILSVGSVWACTQHYVFFGKNAAHVLYNLQYPSFNFIELANLVHYSVNNKTCTN